jgi:hypothetical protein
MFLMALSGCENEGMTEPETIRYGQHQQAVSSLGIEKVIPIRFVFLNNDSSTMQCTKAGSTPAQAYQQGYQLAQAQQAVRRTNETWKAAGVQFTVQSVENYVAPHLMLFKSDTIGRPYDYVSSELSPIFSPTQISQTSTFTVMAGLPKVVEWTGYAAVRFAANDAVLAYVGGCDNSFSGGAYATRNIQISGCLDNCGLGDNNLLSHELGHFFNLNHTSEMDGSTNQPTNGHGLHQGRLLGPYLLPWEQFGHAPPLLHQPQGRHRLPDRWRSVPQQPSLL